MIKIHLYCTNFKTLESLFITVWGALIDLRNQKVIFNISEKIPIGLKNGSLMKNKMDNHSVDFLSIPFLLELDRLKYIYILACLFYFIVCFEAESKANAQRTLTIN